MACVPQERDGQTVRERERASWTVKICERKEFTRNAFCKSEIK